MSKELLLVVDAVAAEKGVPESVILEAIEAALASAAKKRYAEQDVLVRVAIDPKDGSYETFRRWEVVADDVVMESPDRQVRLMDALDESEDAEVGDYIEEQIENPDFGRIAAQAAKQVIVQRVREAERAQVVDAWKDRVGELITGVSTWAATPRRSFPRTRASRAMSCAPATACAATCSTSARSRAARSCSSAAPHRNS